MLEPLVYKVSEVAALTKLTEGGVRKQVKAGTWPTPVIRLGSAIRFPAAPLHRWLDGESSAAPGSGSAAVEPGAAVIERKAV